MGKSRLLVGILAASLALSPAVVSASGPPPAGKMFGTGATGWVWGIFGCSGGIIFTALVANWQQNRQLTMNEAMTCGLLFWFTPPKGKPR
jgi:hypothetical protein